MSNQIEVYTKEANTLVKRGNTIVIDSPETMIEATEILSQVNKNMDRIKEEKEKVLAPLREAANAEKARWEPLEVMFKPIVERIRSAMGVYQTAALKKKAEDDVKIANRIGAGSGKLKVETAIRQMTENVVDVKINTEIGGLSFREKKVLKITDPALVPKMYWVIDEDAVMTALKNGTAVSGAEIEIVQVPVNKR